MTTSNRTQPKQWKHAHPHLTRSFLENFREPDSIHDAQFLTELYEETAFDHERQIEMVDLELSLLEDEDGSFQGCDLEKVEDLKEKKWGLLRSARFHKNAERAFKYWGNMEKKLQSGGTNPRVCIEKMPGR